MLEVGKVYYFIEHAYYHYIGRVVAITGKRECVLDDVRRIHSHPRDFTDFFKNGSVEGSGGTVFTVWPDGHNISNWMSHTPWHHRIPGTEAEKARKR